jgi:hypothetical protein
MASSHLSAQSRSHVLKVLLYIAWILQHLHHEMVLAPKGPFFQNKCFKQCSCFTTASLQSRIVTKRWYCINKSQNNTWPSVLSGCTSHFIIKLFKNAYPFNSFKMLTKYFSIWTKINRKFFFLFLLQSSRKVYEEQNVDKNKVV